MFFVRLLVCGFGVIFVNIACNNLSDRRSSLRLVAFNCEPAILETEFRNNCISIPVGVNSLSIGEWIVRPPVIQDKERYLTET